MKNSDRQAKLDKQKWALSEQAGRDMCGTFEHCQVCKHEAKYPCAKAYIRAHRTADKEDDIVEE